MKTFFTAISAAVVLAAIYGYVCNIIGLIQSLCGDLTAMFVARIVGVFVFPLGSILGFF